MWKNNSKINMRTIESIKIYWSFRKNFEMCSAETTIGPQKRAVKTWPFDKTPPIEKTKTMHAKKIEKKVHKII